LTLEDYNTYKLFGGSLGHNAPAGQHKTNIDIYNETFLLSNISPQEIVHNTGLWALLENWCKLLARNNNLYDITIFTGNIPDVKDKYLNNLLINIPIKMYKIVCFKHINKPNVLFIDIFMTNNSPYYINPTTQKYSLEPYIIPTKSWEWFQNFTSIDLNLLLNFYNLTTDFTKLKSFKNIIHTNIYLSESLKILMKKSNWFGKLVYSRNLDELEATWLECQKLEKIFETLSFHREYYEFTKKRLQNKLLSKYKSNSRVKSTSKYGTKNIHNKKLYTIHTKSETHRKSTKRTKINNM
jgi:hypothetical protein